MKNLIIIAALAICTFAAQSTYAQKMGYVNSALLLSEHPDIKAADSKLEGLQTQYAKQIQDKIAVLQGKYSSLEKERANIAPKELQDRVAALQQEEQALAQEEQSLQQEFLKKREELYQPILDKVNNAISEVGKEGSYLFIFDASQGALLFTDETLDLTSAIKAKLGM